MRPYVYKLTDRETNEFYIGVRYANKDEAKLDLGIKYFSSSKVVKQRGFNSFISEIVQEFDNKLDALECESRLISESWGNRLLLNRANKGVKFKNDSPRPQHVKDKLREANLGKQRGPHSDDHRKKIGDANRGKTLSNGRKPLSDETKLKMKNAPRKKITCPNCLKSVDPGNYKRYHGVACKSQSSGM